MDSKDYYRLLQIERDASATDIKKAYRKLARRFHPDVNLDEDSEEHFKAIGEAYAVLSDPQKREAYNRTGNPDLAGHASPAHMAGWPGPCRRGMGGYMGKCSGLAACFVRPARFAQRKAAPHLSTEIDHGYASK